MIRKSYLLTATLIVLALILIALTSKGGATRFGDTNVTPTAIPPEILTRIAQDSASISATQTAFPPLATQAAQTQQALQLTLAAVPTSDIQEAYPIFNNAPPSIDELLFVEPEGTLAGYGILNEDQEWGSFYSNHNYIFNGLIWQQTTHDAVIWVRGGQALESPVQGAVWVSSSPHYSNSANDYYVVIESPILAGALNIIGAVGERLILTSEQGQTFYFDVPALRFVESLEEIVPTVTPLPTMVFEPPLVPTDDALDEPLYLDAFQLEDTDVNYYINSPGDYDWFAFVSQAEGKLRVSLIPRGNNYGLKVVLVDEDGNGTIIGEDTASGGGAKQVKVDNAPSGNYIVRVWSLDGSYDERQPYTLRFEPPKPEKIIPILECVTENPDGTFTAHYGYENPNPYVVVIDSRHQNTFHPGPVFRTNQPEYFAPGRVEDYFAVLFDGNGLTWVLDGYAVTANRNSPRCP